VRLVVNAAVTELKSRMAASNYTLDRRQVVKDVFDETAQMLAKTKVFMSAAFKAVLKKALTAAAAQAQAQNGAAVLRDYIENIRRAILQVDNTRGILVENEGDPENDTWLKDLIEHLKREEARLRKRGKNKDEIQKRLLRHLKKATDDDELFDAIKTQLDAIITEQQLKDRFKVSEEWARETQKYVQQQQKAFQRRAEAQVPIQQFSLKHIRRALRAAEPEKTQWISDVMKFLTEAAVEMRDEEKLDDDVIRMQLLQYLKQAYTEKKHYAQWRLFLQKLREEAAQAQNLVREGPSGTRYSVSVSPLVEEVVQRAAAAELARSLTRENAEAAQQKARLEQLREAVRKESEEAAQARAQLNEMREVVNARAWDVDIPNAGLVARSISKKKSAEPTSRDRRVDAELAELMQKKLRRSESAEAAPVVAAAAAAGVAEQAAQGAVDAAFQAQSVAAVVGTGDAAANAADAGEKANQAVIAATGSKEASKAASKANEQGDVEGAGAHAAEANRLSREAQDAAAGANAAANKVKRLSRDAAGSPLLKANVEDAANRVQQLVQASKEASPPRAPVLQAAEAIVEGLSEIAQQVGMERSKLVGILQQAQAAGVPRDRIVKFIEDAKARNVSFDTFLQVEKVAQTQGSTANATLLRIKDQAAYKQYRTNEAKANAYLEKQALKFASQQV
jgi:hypothetical protein